MIFLWQASPWQAVYLFHWRECKPVWMPSNSLKSHVAWTECMSCTPRPCVNWKCVHIKKKTSEFKTLVYIWRQNLGFLTSGSALAVLVLCCTEVLTLMSPTHISPLEGLQSHCLNTALNLLWVLLQCDWLRCVWTSVFLGWTPYTWVPRTASPQHWPPLLPSPQHYSRSCFKLNKLNYESFSHPVLKISTA